MPVYFIQSGEHVKIGHAKNVKNRLADIQVATPTEVELLGIIRTGKAHLLEAEIHGMFNANHVRGEWFRLTPELTQYIALNAEPLERRNIIDRGAMPDHKLLQWLSDMKNKVDAMRSAIPTRTTPTQLELF